MTSSNDARDGALVANNTSQGEVAASAAAAALPPRPPSPSPPPPIAENSNTEPVAQIEAATEPAKKHIKLEAEPEAESSLPQPVTDQTIATIPTAPADDTPNIEDGLLPANYLDYKMERAEPELPPQSRTQLELNATVTSPGQLLDPVPGASQLPDHYMPSPPTVSPLSTPAVTAIHSTNGDNPIDDDLPKLTDEHISAATLSAMDRSLLAQQGLAGLTNPEAYAAHQAQYHGYAAVATTDDDVAYPQHALNNRRLSRSNTVNDIDPAAFMLGMTPSANAPLPSDYPTAIAPSEISLAASQGGQDDGTFESASASASQKLESFARIEFADSVFQMTTYAVIIGRDQRAMEQARKDTKRLNRYREACERAEERGLPPPTPMARDGVKFSKSYVSEEGGILGPESDGGDSNAPKKKAPSQHDEVEVNEDQDDKAQTNLQYVSHSEGAAAVDLTSMQPSSSHVPFVGIHSPGPDIAAKTKGISRQHLKIQFSERKGVFEGIAMHKNGFFCDDVHYSYDQPVTIRCGSRIQIKDVIFHFVINGVEHGKTGAEDLHEADEASSKRCSVGGKEMSLEFEHSDQEQRKKFLRNTDSPSPAEVVATPPALMDPLREEEELLEEELAEEDEDAEEAALLDDQVDYLGDDQALPFLDMDAETAAILLQSVEGTGELPPDFVMPRRRGPGRPPKDGIMSKRERRLLKKQIEAQQISKKTLPQEPAGEKIKRPVGRPRKNPLPEDGDRPEKRKYTKRKREDGEEGSDLERRSKDKKDKKVRPKSPPLDLKIEDYTPEQLKKPAKNYVHLIDEALQAAPEEGLSLKQIYKRITAAYPWYFFSAETKGWESSVRHNLIGNDGFRKNDETGLWQRVHGIDLDAGKKRKAPTPERQLGSLHQMGQQAYYHHPTYMQQGTLQFADGLPGNMTTNAQHQQSYGQSSSQVNQHYGAAQSQTNGQVSHATQIQGPSSHLAAAPGSSALPRQPVPQSAYSSPYGRPSTTTNTQFNAAPLAPNTHGQHAPLPQSTAQNPRPQQSAAPVAPAAAKSGLGGPADNPRIIAFKEQMLKMLSSLSVSPARIQQLVETAIDKAYGLPTLPTLAGFEKVEFRLKNEVLKIIGDDGHQPTVSPAPAPAPAPVTAPLPTSNTTAHTPAAAAPPPNQQTPAPRPSPAASSLADAEVESSLAIFRNNFMKTFRSKCPQADFIMESAVNQAKGLPNAGKVKGWEQVNDLLVTEVTKIINNVRKKFSSQVSSAASPQQPLQASPSPAVRHATSASPTPGQPASSSAAGTNPGQTAGTPYSPSVAKPTTPAARPSIMRPGAVSVARPSINRQTSGMSNPALATSPSKPPPQAPIQAPATVMTSASAPAVAPAPVPAPASAPLQSAAKPSTPAPASVPGPGPSPSPAPAPMHAPATTMAISKAPMASPIVQSVPPARPVSASAPTAPAQSLGPGTLHDTPVPKTISPLPQTMTHPPLAKTASPAPPPTTVPSAGVLNQIMGQGQKRSLESVHGPGNDGSHHQPEAKKVSTSAP